MSPPRPVPIDLGGSPTPCRVQPAPRPAPRAPLIAALIEHYGERHPGEELLPAFVNGGLPRPDQVEALGGRPFRLACNPADLDPAALERLCTQGLRSLELEALSLEPAILQQLRRGHSPARLPAQIAAARAQGLQVGLTMMPGLPGSSHAQMLEEARRVLELRPDHLRLLPALALSGSGLAELHRQGSWTPMRQSQCLRLLVDLLDLYEEAGMPVLRVGQQPAADSQSRLVAGPHHPNLRGLVDGLRLRRRIAALLAAEPDLRGASVELALHPADMGAARGESNRHLRELRISAGLAGMRLLADPALSRGRPSLRRLDRPDAPSLSPARPLLRALPGGRAR